MFESLRKSALTYLSIFRYVEFIIQGTLGFLFFSEVITTKDFACAVTLALCIVLAMKKNNYLPVNKVGFINIFSIFKVLPGLLKVTHDRVIFEEYISFLVFDLFGECETVDEIISLADKLQKDIHDKKKHIFDKLIPDCLLDDLYWEPLVRGIKEKDKKKAFRKVCDQLCTQLLEYIHPYYSGVMGRNSILCRVFKYSKEG